MAGGLSPNPGIYIAAEDLNLVTSRSMPFMPSDDLNALDFVGTPLLDCNANGIEDVIDIVSGLALDLNGNGVPDDCEVGIETPYCFCTAAVAPCNNAFRAGGCINASGSGTVMTGAGSASVAADNLVLTTTGMNPLGFALTFYGTLAIAPLTRHNGLHCANGTNYRLPPYSTLAGTAALGPGIVAQSIFNHGPVGGGISAGTTWQFQTWYRDVGSPCGAFSNFSNALSVSRAIAHRSRRRGPCA